MPLVGARDGRPELIRKKLVPIQFKKIFPFDPKTKY